MWRAVLELVRDVRPALAPRAAEVQGGPLGNERSELHKLKMETREAIARALQYDEQTNETKHQQR